MCACDRNIVSTVNMDCRLELKTIALHARNAEYNPKVLFLLLYHACAVVGVFYASLETGRAWIGGNSGSEAFGSVLRRGRRCPCMNLTGFPSR